jgi:hypothetical protein
MSFSATHGKHKHTLDTLDTIDEDIVQVVFTNLVKPINTNTNTNTNTITTKSNQKANKRIRLDEFAGVIVNGIIYHFNGKDLYEKEPGNCLLNVHSAEYRKHVNKNNNLIEYLDKLPDFGLAIDYINGYSYKNFEEIFNTNYSKYQEFRAMLVKLEFTNLLNLLDNLYPLVNINGIMVIVSRHFINSIEPGNKLLDPAKMHPNKTYTHFRDRNLFNKYFLDYFIGTKTQKDTANTINDIRKSICSNTGDTGDTSSNTKIASNKDEIKYLLTKINNDIDYYGLCNLIAEINKTVC